MANQSVTRCETVCPAGSTGRVALRVMTWNIRHGLGNAGPDDPAGTVDLNRTARVIRAQRSDIVALQELDRFWGRSRNEDQAAKLAGLLGMHVCFAANVVAPEPDAPATEYGVAVLSRFPIVGHRVHPFAVLSGWEPRGMMMAEIDLGGQAVLVICTHLQYSRPDQTVDGQEQRRAQVCDILQAAHASPLPVIIMGDFNARPDDPELAALCATGSGLRDAWKAGGAGPGATIPASPEQEPRDRIDYILTSREYTVQRAWNPDSPDVRTASDHFPVVADLFLPGNHER